MSRMPEGRLIGRAAAQKLLADARKRIDLQNSLANAVRTVHNLYCPCAEHVQLRKDNAAWPFPADQREGVKK